MKSGKILLYVLAIALSFNHTSSADPYFRITGLMNIPTAYVLEQGIFSAGVYTAIHDQKRDDLGIKMYFGVFNRAELGIMGIKRLENDYVMGNIKLLLSREKGSTPGLAIGVDNLGEKIENGSAGYERSFYGVISKQFNLPIAHIISGHLGVGSHRYSGETSIGKYLHGVFMGLDKEFQLPFLDSRLCLMFEVDGKDINAGLRYAMDTGLSIALALGELTSGFRDFKYYIGISFTNESMIKEISQSKELAKKAAKIAIEARSNVTEPEKESPSGKAENSQNIHQGGVKLK